VRRQEGFHRTSKGFECYLDLELAAAIRRSAREVQELIASEPAVEGLAAVGPDEESVEDTELGAFTELQGMLAAGTLAGLAGLGGEVPPISDDPALARLFPAAYAEPEAAEEYRRFTYTELHGIKVAALEQLARQLTELAPDIVLDEESAEVWLAAINDIRLVIGSRIGIKDDEADDGEPLVEQDDMRAVAYGLYVLLTALQETLVEALAGW
jgi:hypothetical protein